MSLLEPATVVNSLLCVTSDVLTKEDHKACWDIVFWMFVAVSSYHCHSDKIQYCPTAENAMRPLTLQEFCVNARYA